MDRVTKRKAARWVIYLFAATMPYFVGVFISFNWGWLNLSDSTPGDRAGFLFFYFMGAAIFMLIADLFITNSKLWSHYDNTRYHR